MLYFAEHVAQKIRSLLNSRKTALRRELAKMEMNIEELLNGIKDFVEGQKELADAKGDIGEFLRL